MGNFKLHKKRIMKSILIPPAFIRNLNAIKMKKKRIWPSQFLVRVPNIHIKGEQIHGIRIAVVKEIFVVRQQLLQNLQVLIMGTKKQDSLDSVDPQQTTLKMFGHQNIILRSPVIRNILIIKVTIRFVHFPVLSVNLSSVCTYNPQFTSEISDR